MNYSDYCHIYAPFGKGGELHGRNRFNGTKRWKLHPVRTIQDFEPWENLLTAPENMRWSPLVLISIKITITMYHSKIHPLLPRQTPENGIPCGKQHISVTKKHFLVRIFRENCWNFLAVLGPVFVDTPNEDAWFDKTFLHVKRTFSKNNMQIWPLFQMQKPRLLKLAFRLRYSYNFAVSNNKKRWTGETEHSASNTIFEFPYATKGLQIKFRACSCVSISAKL